MSIDQRFHKFPPSVVLKTNPPRPTAKPFSSSCMVRQVIRSSREQPKSAGRLSLPPVTKPKRPFWSIRTNEPPTCCPAVHAFIRADD